MKTLLLLIALFIALPAQAWAAFTYVASGTRDTSDGGVLTPTLPAGLTVGDLMVTFCASRENTDGTLGISAGWSQIFNVRAS